MAAGITSGLGADYDFGKEELAECGLQYTNTAMDRD